MKVAKYYMSADGKRFEVLSVWSPDDESGTMVRYVNNATGDDYTCRLEAFLSRFTETPN
jgi:gentisate 1,2-dioxygenase